jgi:ADP-sugar diphosphatase
MATIFTLDGFHLPHSDLAPEVYLPDGIGINEEQLRKFHAFVTWHDTLKANLALQHTEADHAFHAEPYSLHKIEVQSVDWFGRSKIGFVKIKSFIRSTKPKSEPLPGIAFLRGGSVAVLMILRPSDSLDERWVVMTQQPRVPAGSLSFFEIPAGMLDGSNNLQLSAAREIKEETGLTMQSSELINLTELALRNSKVKEPNLKPAMYPSPGGSDEFIVIFLWEKVGVGFCVFQNSADECYRNWTVRRLKI